MPATYVDDSQPTEDMQNKTPTNLPQQEADINGMDAAPTTKQDTLQSQKSDMDHQQVQNSPPTKADISDRMNSDKGPMEEEAPAKTNNKQQESSLRGDHTIQNSLGGVGEKYKNNQDLAKPTETKLNDRHPDDLDSGHQRSQHQSEPTFSQTNDVDSSKMEGHRRSSLTHSIGKLFGRNHKSG
ncbi:unnamed protein product [Absidia cylindrospora]